MRILRRTAILGDEQTACQSTGQSPKGDVALGTMRWASELLPPGGGLGPKWWVSRSRRSKSAASLEERREVRVRWKEQWVDVIWRHVYKDDEGDGSVYGYPYRFGASEHHQSI